MRLFRLIYTKCGREVEEIDLVWMVLGSLSGVLQPPGESLAGIGMYMYLPYCRVVLGHGWFAQSSLLEFIVQVRWDEIENGIIR